VMRAEMDFRANEQTSQIEAAKLQLQAEEAARTHEREMLRMQIEADQAAAEMEIKRVELQIKQQELGLRAQEVADRGTIEREKLADGQKARRESTALEKMKMAKDGEEREDAEAEMDDKPSKTDRLIEAMATQQAELVKVLTRPKKIKRGPDGRAVGVE
jgi:hypothetical protein